ncbi:unnamed protein product [Amoebophrya sp. A25]|nr:unnamed protein product [Amoebophrya sp. A25]|eukprot:GSA25T00003759001.1
MSEQEIRTSADTPESPSAAAAKPHGILRHHAEGETSKKKHAHVAMVAGDDEDDDGEKKHVVMREEVSIRTFSSDDVFLDGRDENKQGRDDSSSDENHMDFGDKKKITNAIRSRKAEGSSSPTTKTKINFKHPIRSPLSSTASTSTTPPAPVLSKENILAGAAKTKTLVAFTTAGPRGASTSSSSRAGGGGAATTTGQEAEGLGQDGAVESKDTRPGSATRTERAAPPVISIVAARSTSSTSTIDAPATDAPSEPRERTAQVQVQQQRTTASRSPRTRGGASSAASAVSTFNRPVSGIPGLPPMLTSPSRSPVSTIQDEGAPVSTQLFASGAAITDSDGDYLEITVSPRYKTAISKEQIEKDRAMKNQVWAKLATDVPPVYTDGYWEERYMAQRAFGFDWYMDYSSLRGLLAATYGETAPDEIAPETLIIGNGNSDLPFGLYEDGYKNVTCIDRNAIVVDIMSRKLAKKGYADEMEYIQMDCRNMKSFPNASFGAVIDKATLDILEASTTLTHWHNSTKTAAQQALDVENDMKKCVSEVLRVLTPGGFFLSVSTVPPTQRVPRILTLNGTAPWRIEVSRMRKPNVPFLPGTQDGVGTTGELLGGGGFYGEQRRDEIDQEDHGDDELSDYIEKDYFLYICTMPRALRHVNRVESPVRSGSVSPTRGKHSRTGSSRSPSRRRR